SSYVSTAERKRARLARLMYLGLFCGLGGSAAWLARDWDEEEQKAHPNVANGISNAWSRFSIRFADFFAYYREPAFDNLLPDPLPPMYQRPYTLVIDLEDFLIHSSWNYSTGWRTAKRPGTDYFLGYLSMMYEIVVFSSDYSINSAKAVNKLDPYKAAITYSLYREATRYENGKIIKDLTHLNRDPAKVIVITTNQDYASANPDNAIVVKPWTGDPNDTELYKLAKLLDYPAISGVKDMRTLARSYKGVEDPGDECARREDRIKAKSEQEWNSKRSKYSISFNWLLGLGDSGSSPKSYIDAIRESNNKEYLKWKKFIDENGSKILAEEEQRNNEMIAQQ
ncbi:hypothetical protein CANCADRAFT_20435, partial [Tortispora caseinolytica NRRL Y-17796]